jgi:hypothetical protein
VLVIRETGTMTEVTARPNSGGSGPPMLSEYQVKDIINALMTAQSNDLANDE